MEPIQLLGIAITVVCLLISLFQWFLSPYLIDKHDPSPSPIRPYTFRASPSSAPQPFPSIRDAPTKCISLIFPAYNEQSRINACLDPTIAYLIDRETKSAHSDDPFSWEIIVVSDGSTDSTSAIVESYIAKHKSDKVRLLSYNQNQGKGFAVQQGMLHARGSVVLFADADGASEITHLSRLESALMSELGVVKLSECGERDAIAIGSRAHLQSRAEV